MILEIRFFKMDYSIIETDNSKSVFWQIFCRKLFAIRITKCKYRQLKIILNLRYEKAICLSCRALPAIGIVC